MSALLRSALADCPDLVLDPAQLADRIVGPLARRLAGAATAAGASAMALARGLEGGPIRPGGAIGGADSPGGSNGAVKARVLAALARHAAGREPGVAPESLASLTGLAAEQLGPAVSALVQAGELVRDAWLVRLPHVDDLLPISRPDLASDARHTDDRRSIGDRRAVGERRLYERRTDSSANE